MLIENRACVFPALECEGAMGTLLETAASVVCVLAFDTCGPSFGAEPRLVSKSILIKKKGKKFCFHI
jgi:hypothetical protein